MSEIIDMKKTELLDVDAVVGGAPVSYGPPKYSTNDYMDSVKRIADSVDELEKNIRQTLLPQFGPVVA